MRKGLFTLCLALACTGLAGIPSVKIVGVYPPDGVRDARNIGDRQYILTGGKVPALIARDRTTGATMWKTPIGGKPRFNKEAIANGILFVKDQVRAGDFFFMNEKATLIGSDGAIVFTGYSSYVTRLKQVVMITKEQDVFYPDSLYDEDRAGFWIANLDKMYIDKTGFKILRRQNCKSDKYYWMRDPSNSVFIVGSELILSLRDSCGFYFISYNWTLGSTSKPRMHKGIFDNKKPIIF